MEFYFDIKARVSSGSDSFTKWSWPPVWSGRVEAESSKEARKKIEEEYGRKFILKDSKNLKEEMFLLSIKPMTPYLAKRFEITNCQVCDTEYTANDVYSVGISDVRFCSRACKEENELKKLSENYSAFNNYSTPPVIYCIRNIKEDKCYVGKSIRSFTLRWWEHIKVAKVLETGNSKFHAALKNSELSDWEFKVLETIEYPTELLSYTDRDRFLLKRETEWIKKLNSIENGYNTLESIKNVT